MAGVAIETKAGLLANALGDDPNIEIGYVKYVDYRTAFAGFHDRIFWKRKSLSHEAEVRAVVKRRNSRDVPGLSLAVNIQALLLAVVPSPFAPAWFSSLLEATLARYDVDVKVRRSELLSDPFF